MQEYLAILLRTEFNLIYRLGYGVLFKNQVIPFDGIVNESLNHKLVDCFDKLTPFEYDEEYLILHLSLSRVIEESFEVRPEDINSIYPLSKQAKASIESKIDSRIRLENPIFENAIELVKDRLLIKSIEKATNIVFRICGLENTGNEWVSDDEIINGLEKRKGGAKGGHALTGSFWEILIAYDRYDYFPNSILGYLYDVGNVFSYFKGKKDGVVGTKLNAFLDKLNATDPKIKLLESIKLLENDQSSEKFIEENKVIGKGTLKPYLAAALFLIWKDELRNPEKALTASSVIHNGKISFYNDYPNEVRVAIHLLAAFFGYNRFYDEFYNVANLKFYKTYTAPVIREINEVTSSPENKLSATSEEKVSEQLDSDLKEPSEQKQSEIPIQMPVEDKLQENKVSEPEAEPKKALKKTSVKKGKSGSKKTSIKNDDQPKLDL